MKIFFETKEKCIVLLIAVCQLLVTYCSIQFYPEQTFQNIESQAEKKKLKDFMDEGIEKVINTRNTSPDEIIKQRKNSLVYPLHGRDYFEMP
jgi:hypothetical protein